MNSNTKEAKTIVDVRTPEEFGEGHVAGAINIPLDQIPQRLQEVKKMQTPIVAYCRSGNRSGMAVSILKQNGINDVSNGGGLDDMLQQIK
jgi:phage shock protein E